jgi:hypothetical protein
LTQVRLTNGSRIISLPGSERTIRGYSGVSLILLDEAARIDDELVAFIAPMQATVPDGRFIVLSTPPGHRGWFYTQWTEGENWERVSVTASQCPRISREFLEQVRRSLGPLMYDQEYEGRFVDADTSAFSNLLIEQALTDEFKPFV